MFEQSILFDLLFILLVISASLAFNIMVLCLQIAELIKRNSACTMLSRNSTHTFLDIIIVQLGFSLKWCHCFLLESSATYYSRKKNSCNVSVPL